MFVEQKKKPNYTKEQFIPFVKEFYNEQKEFNIEEMEHAYRMHVPLKADCGWGKNWLEAH